MSLQVGKAIYNILSNDVDVVNKVNKKIYPLVADQSTTFPFIVYRRTGLEPSTTKDRYIYSSSAIIQIVIASENYNDSVDIAEKVKDALIGKSGIYSNIEILDITLINADEDYFEDTFIQTLTLNIKLK